MFLAIKHAFDLAISQGFNPVGYIISGKTLVIHDPADTYKELYAVPKDESLSQGMYELEILLRARLLLTKQYEYIKRQWVHKVPTSQRKIEQIDLEDHECLHCNRTIQSGDVYWLYDMRRKHMDDPERGYLIYCDECVGEQEQQQKVDDLFKSDDEPWKHADD